MYALSGASPRTDAASAPYGTWRSSRSPATARTRHPRSRRRPATSSSSRDLPMPAAPETATATSPAVGTRSTASSTSASSASRPTSVMSVKLPSRYQLGTPYYGRIARGAAIAPWRSKAPATPASLPVREEFERNFAERGEVGASVCVTVDGETVVDLWGGTADPATGRAWDGRHHRQRVVGHQGRHRAVRTRAGRPRPTRRGRAGDGVLAGVRQERQGGGAGPAPAQPPGRRCRRCAIPCRPAASTTGS